MEEGLIIDALKAISSMLGFIGGILAVGLLRGRWFFAIMLLFGVGSVKAQALRQVSIDYVLQPGEIKVCAWANNGRIVYIRRADKPFSGGKMMNATDCCCGLDWHKMQPVTQDKHKRIMSVYEFSWVTPLTSVCGGTAKSGSLWMTNIRRCSAIGGDYLFVSSYYVTSTNHFPVKFFEDYDRFQESLKYDVDGNPIFPDGQPIIQLERDLETGSISGFSYEFPEVPWLRPGENGDYVIGSEGVPEWQYYPGYAPLEGLISDIESNQREYYNYMRNFVDMGYQPPIDYSGMLEDIAGNIVDVGGKIEDKQITVNVEVDNTGGGGNPADLSIVESRLLSIDNALSSADNFAITTNNVYNIPSSDTMESESYESYINMLEPFGFGLSGFFGEIPSFSKQSKALDYEIPFQMGGHTEYVKVSLDFSDYSLIPMFRNIILGSILIWFAIISIKYVMEVL